ncbi:MAG: His/Gly/Thr/Pro-type tRNA ligase C-terminal domain-containing protein [Saprospiraceae bacterium]
MPIPKPSAEINDAAERIMKELREKGIRVRYDQDEKNRPGFKFAEHELKGIYLCRLVLVPVIWSNLS